MVDSAIYELPDRTTLAVGRESVDMSNTLLGEGGVKSLIARSLEELEPEARRDVLSHLVFVGGTTQHCRLSHRLSAEMADARDPLNHMLSNYRVKTVWAEAKHARTASWIGASVIAALSNFDALVLTRRDYEEHGYSLVERKFS